MKKDLFTDGVSHIDVDAVERLLQIEQDMQNRQRRQRRTRLLIIPAAALLALLVCMTAVIIPFIPKTLELDYQPSKGAPENVWVYYVNENGAQKRELVKQPQGAQNVFTSWKHLNTVDNEVQLLDYTVTTEPMAGATVVPDTLWESLLQMLDKDTDQTIVTATLSAQITSYENYDALIESLKQTIAKYAGVDPEQVRILIDGEQVGIVGGLQFYHSLHNAPLVVGEGSTLEITVGMTNISNENIEFTGSWSAFAPSAVLTMDNTAVITHEDFPMTEEYQKYILAPGESREITYTFLVPQDAPTGAYDLLVSFGQKHMEFAGVVQVVYFTVPTSATEFHEFLIKYGFVTTDPEAFKTAVGTLSYHSGKSLFDIMTQADIEYAEGYDGEEYGSDLFAYGYVRKPDGSCNNYFIGLAIPDDMRLPHGIAPGDRLVDSLHKMGLDTNSAQDTVEKAKPLSEGEQLVLGNEFFTFCITRTSYGEYVILYSFIAAPVDGHPAPPEYSIEIIYSEANMTFQCFRVKAGYEEFSTDAFSGPIIVSLLDARDVSRELNAQDTQTLLDILNNGSWHAGEIDVAYEYRVAFAGKVYFYSASSGIFMCNGHYLQLFAEQLGIVSDIIRIGNYQPNFQSITLKENNLLAPLPAPVAEHILNALNRAEWNDGCMELVPVLEFDCDGTTVGYSDGTFFTTQHYWNAWYADSYTEDCTNALQDAIIGLRTNEYDAIIYYAGTYFGHSAAVDEKLNGTVNFSMNIQPEFLEDILYAHDDKQTVSTFGGIVDCKNAVDKGVLVTRNGAYFERITEIMPNFGNGEVKLIRTPAGEPPIGELTEEDAQTLCEIFQRAEFTYCFADHDTEYETILEIGGYTISYLSAWGDARIGDLKATLSEQDTQTVGEILGGYVNVE